MNNYSDVSAFKCINKKGLIKKRYNKHEKFKPANHSGKVVDFTEDNAKQNKFRKRRRTRKQRKGDNNTNPVKRRATSSHAHISGDNKSIISTNPGNYKIKNITVTNSDNGESVDLKKRKTSKIVSDSTVQNSSNYNYFFRKTVDGQKMFTPVSNHPENSSKLFSYMLYPRSIESFMRKDFEKSPVFIQRKYSDYYSGLLQLSDVDRILRDNDVYYTRHLDVAICTDGNRETMNPEGKVEPYAVWDYYSNHCTLRLSSPQMFLPNLHFFNVTLQDYFGCYVGTNIYLTPANSQGFAAHYDDIEAFILQIEGRKHWKVYEPKTEDEKLPRYSSRDFTKHEISAPSFEFVLNPGDLLYLPRGFVHQCFSDPEQHSLHITVSVYQRNAWIDLLEKAIPSALETAWKKDVEYRKGLPLHFLQSTGFSRSPDYNSIRDQIIDKVKSLINKLPDYMDIDQAADEIGNTFVHSSLPPFMTDEDKSCLQIGTAISVENGAVSRPLLYSNTKVKLISRFACRLSKVIKTNDDDADNIEYRLSYSTENSKQYQGEDIKFFVIPYNMLESVQYLIQHHAQFVPISDLPYSDIDELLQLVTDLWEVNLILTSEQLSFVS